MQGSSGTDCPLCGWRLLRRGMTKCGADSVLEQEVLQTVSPVSHFPRFHSFTANDNHPSSVSTWKGLNHCGLAVVLGLYP